MYGTVFFESYYQKNKIQDFLSQVIKNIDQTEEFKIGFLKVFEKTVNNFEEKEIDYFY